MKKRSIAKFMQAVVAISLGVSAAAAWSSPAHTISVEPDQHAYIDKRGNIVFRLPPNTDGRDFSSGVVRFSPNLADCCSDAAAYLDLDGGSIGGTFRNGSDFSEGLAKIGEPGKVGFIDRAGKIVIPQIYSDALGFREGLAPVKVSNGFGFIDRTGKIVIDPFFEYVSGFSEGLAAVQSQGKIGYIDKSGKWRIEPQFDRGHGFFDGLALVLRESKMYYVDRDGRKVISLDDKKTEGPFFDWESSETGMSVESSIMNGFTSGVPGNPCTFKEGLSPLYKDKKYGYIDKTGNFVLAPKFDKAYPFVNGLASVCVNGKYGFIDKTGAFVIKPAFRKVQDFSEGAAAVAIGPNQWGYIDATGKYQVQPKYRYVWPFRDGRAHVQVTGSYSDGIK